MQRETQLRLLQDCLDHIERRAPDMAEASSSPVARYLDPGRYQAETQNLFRREPLLVGFSSQLAGVGDLITHDAAGVPIVVVRQRDRSLKAYLNVCRHRGTRVVGGPCATGKRTLTCPYHGWTYSLDGKLASMPHPAGFSGLDHSLIALVELPVAEAYGMVFVRPMARGEAIDAAALLGPLAEDFASFGFATHVMHAPVEFTKAINWKLFFDASLEAYHFKHAHARTIATMFLDNQATWEWFERNGRGVLPKRSILELKAMPQEQWHIRERANVLYSIFPNTVVLVEPDHAQIMQVWPTAIDRTLVTSCMFLPEAPADDKAREHWAKNATIFFNALEEDFDMMESIQCGLATGANEELRFGRYEHQSAAFHRAVEASLPTQK
ncbi:MAG: aromatic ring-hydroxylating dioxygenase subunit alpha [Alphaproteobacteria bacterium]